MAQEIGEEDQCRKRKKWIENLSILSSDEEEDCSFSTTTNEKDKQSILDSNKAIYLRFPYYMCSDNSEDEDGIKYFADVCPRKRDKKKIVSSSDEMSEISRENHSYKHTKRKQKSNKQKLASSSGNKSQKRKSFPHTRETPLLDKKENKENSSAVLLSKDFGSSKDSHIRYKMKHSKPYKNPLKPSKITQDSLSSMPHIMEDNMKEVPKKRLSRQRRAKTYTPLFEPFRHVYNEREHSNAEDNKDEQLQSNDNINSSRFLDSSPENSNTEHKMNQTKKIGYRRVHFLSTSPSSSDSEKDTNNFSPEDFVPSRNRSSEGNQPKASSKPRIKEGRAVISTSEEENDSDPQNKAKSEKIIESVVTEETENRNSSDVGFVSSQIKAPINSNAWKNIAISDIKSQFYKQSKVKELKRKLVSSNASSVAIYKKIQNREMLKSKKELRRPVQRAHLNHNFLGLQIEQAPLGTKYDNNPTMSDNLRQEQTCIDSKLRSEAKESSEPYNMSPVHSGEPERRDSLMENTSKNVENLQPTESHLQSSLESLFSISTVSAYGKKIRQAHNKEVKNQSENDSFKKMTPKIKTCNSRSRQKQSCNENKHKESMQVTLDNASTNCDVLGNIMYQMDNNPYKVQKPTIKKLEPTKEMLGWFPSNSNPSLLGKTQNDMCEFQSTHNSPVGVISPAVTRATVTGHNIVNPSYNPLSYAAAPSKKTMQPNVGISQQTGIVISNQNAPKVSGNIPTSKNEQQIQDNYLNSLSKSSSGGMFVPFYSAPKEDYGANSSRSKNGIEAAEKNIFSPFPENQNVIGHNKPPFLECQISNVRSLEGQSSNSSYEGPRVPRDTLHNDIFSKDKESSINKSDDSKHSKVINSLHTRKTNSENHHQPTKQKEDPLKKGPFQAQVPSSLGIPRGNGAICEKLKRNNFNNDTPKGIRIRFRGTEFRLQIKDSDTSENQNSKSNGQDINVSRSEPSLTGKSPGSGLKFSTAGINNKMEQDGVPKTVVNETETVRSETTGSSTTSSSSPNNSSSSTDDSSSESSYESENQSSTEGSTSDSTEHRVQSQNAVDLHTLQATPSCTKPDKKTPLITQCANDKTEKVSELNKLAQRCTTENNQGKPSENISVNEVIILSSSSDSDSNDKSLFKRNNSQILDKVDTSPVQTNNKVSHQENLNDLDNMSPADNNQINSSKIGKIRVKSLKELGVFDDTPVTENVLGPAQVGENSQTKTSNEQLNIPSSSTIKHSHIQPEKTSSDIHAPLRISEKLAPTQVGGISQSQISNKQLNAPSSSTVKHSHIQPEKTSSYINVASGISENNIPGEVQLTKKPQTPVTTIFLPVVPIAVIRPVNSVRLRPTVSTLNQGGNIDSLLDAGSGHSSQVEAGIRTSQDSSSQAATSGSTPSCNQEVRENSSSILAVPTISSAIESAFFELCDQLFTEVVNFKIPKLADDLHLLIAYDVMKEERLKKINQLISPETILSERRRAEKDFADMIKIRGHSFVPLFMTIMNKIDKNSLKTLITAVYCRIVHQLERIDPVNINYRFKVRKIIKSMLQKHSSGVRQEICEYFEEENDSSFVCNFNFIETLLFQYDKYVEQRQTLGTQNEINDSGTSQRVTETLKNQNEIERQSGDSNSSTCIVEYQAPSQPNQPNASEVNHISGPSSHVPTRPPPPLIGNLDEVFLKKNFKK